jgi:hypothetical protein
VADPEVAFGDHGKVSSEMATMTWRLSIPQMTVMVKTGEDRRIVEAAPIVRKFVGQPLDNLVQWMDRKGGVDVMLLQPDGR